MSEKAMLEEVVDAVFLRKDFGRQLTWHEHKAVETVRMLMGEYIGRRMATLEFEAAQHRRSIAALSENISMREVAAAWEEGQYALEDAS